MQPAIRKLPMSSGELIASSVLVCVPFVGTVAAIFWGLVAGFDQLDWAFLVFFYFANLFGISIGFHRHFSHRAFQARKAVRLLLGILGSMGGQGPIVFWAACHRRHHQFSDVTNDPHSPNYPFDSQSSIFLRIWHAHIGWLFCHEPEKRDIVKDLVRDPLVRWIDKYYFLWFSIGIVIPALLGGLYYSSYEAFLRNFLLGGLLGYSLYRIQHGRSIQFYTFGALGHFQQEITAETIHLSRCLLLEKAGTIIIMRFHIRQKLGFSPCS
jgi:stearoyl-CoA desaturase (Delta-9 desaturase)